MRVLVLVRVRVRERQRERGERGILGNLMDGSF